jgi:hypothetical protein
MSFCFIYINYCFTICYSFFSLCIIKLRSTVEFVLLNGVDSHTDRISSDRIGAYSSRRGFLHAVSGAALGCWAGSVLSGKTNPLEQNRASLALPVRTIPTGLVFDDHYLRHSLRPGHPESPERLISILKHLQLTGLDRESFPFWRAVTTPRGLRWR